MVEAWLLRLGQKYGPYSLSELKQWWRAGKLQDGDLIWHPGLPTWIDPVQAFDTVPKPPPVTQNGGLPVNNSERLVRRLSDYEKISAWLWMILGIVQVCTLVGAIAGIWNIIAASSRFRVVRLIQTRDASVPSIYEGLGGLILIGVINLLLGGAIGVLFAAFDLYLRDQVLSNSDLFSVSANQRAPLAT